MTMYHAEDNHSRGQSVDIENVPDECPLCHHKGSFSINTVYFNENKRILECIFRCPNLKCCDVFIGYYGRGYNGSFSLNYTAPKNTKSEVFSSVITNISNDFPVIYNQALQAEQDGLDQICGPGYRKSLEYLVKDYLISQTSDLLVHEKIKEESLGVCISSRIKDENIKAVAKRAVWLGNDETHYVKKWIQKDLQDLKKLINLTINWIENEANTAQILSEMPD